MATHKPNEDAAYRYGPFGRLRRAEERVTSPAYSFWPQDASKRESGERTEQSAMGATAGRQQANGPDR